MASNWMGKPWVSNLQRLVLRVLGVCEHGDSCCQNEELWGVPTYLHKPLYADELANMIDGLPPIHVELVESCEADPCPATNVSAHRSGNVRTLSYWSRGGHFYRWYYTPQTRQEVQRHIGRLAADPCIELTWDDAADIHEKIRFLELTWDSQDVIGW